MQTHEIDVLYGNVTINKAVPSTYEELDALFGEVGGALKSALADLKARNFLPRLYAAYAEKIKTTFPPAVVGTEDKKDGTKKDVYETDIKHVGRYYETLDDAGKATFASEIQTLANDLPLYEKGERGGGGALPQWAKDAANNAINGGQADAVVSHVEANVPGYKVARDGEGNVTVDSLARAIQAFAKHEEQKAKSGIMGLVSQPS